MNADQALRRRVLRLGAAALAAIPIVLVCGQASAAVNAKMRDALSYQPTPEGDQKCANCATFIPGSSPKGTGRCKNIPQDTEIAPQAYCIAWSKKP
jgi:hypothetical protein